MIEEIWLPIFGFESLYEVSNYGRVRALPKAWTSGKGAGSVFYHTGEIISQGVGRYLSINLYNQGARASTFTHRLVAFHFIPNPENKPFVNHIDGDRFNNHFQNLEWCTASENMRHALTTKLLIPSSGERCNFSKLKEKDILSIRSEYATGLTTQAKLAEKYFVNQSAIQRIVTRKHWKHL